jgi:hypothetical protein
MTTSVLPCRVVGVISRKNDCKVYTVLVLHTYNTNKYPFYYQRLYQHRLSFAFYIMATRDRTNEFKELRSAAMRKRKEWNGSVTSGG